MQVLVTGASGFLGSALLAYLQALGAYTTRAVGRSAAGASAFVVPDFAGASPALWAPALVGIDAIVHCAARVHVMDESAVDPLAEFRRANVDGTMNLARQAAAHGVRRFIYISSLKVNGEATATGAPFTADAPPHPTDPYGISKFEAEQQLLELAKSTSMEVVIIRPPLVYGPGVRANFAALLKAVANKLPLPLGAIRNARSLVSVDNLVDLITVCLRHPAAPGNVFLVSDGRDLSTTELIKAMADALGVRARLLPVPPRLLMAAAAMLGKRGAVDRLCGNLQADISKNARVLGWTPPYTVARSLKTTSVAFRKDGR